jgi:hypothetical protein
LPRQGLGVVTLSTTQSLGQMRTFEMAMAVLRAGGVFDASPPKPSASLTAARANVIRLLTQWDTELAARTFDPQSMQYSFLRNLRPDLERMGREQGACQADGDIVPLSLTHGRFRLACERGNIEFMAYLTPAATPRLQSLEYRQNLPVTEPSQAVARAVTAALNGSPLPGELLAEGSDRAAIEKQLARLRGNYGSCELEAPLADNGKNVSSFQLRCAEGRLELTLRFAPKTSLIAEVSGARPRSFGAVCAE